MNRTRDFRRHQMWKHKREAIRRMKEWDYHNQYNNPFNPQHNRLPVWEDPKQIGMSATTPHMCSGRCCNRQRDWEGETLQERKNWLDLLDELVVTDDEFSEYYQDKDWIDLENYLNQIAS